MDGSDPVGGGTTLTASSGNLQFLSANVTSNTTIVNGTFNMRLTYWSDLAPSGVPYPDMAWHFSCDECPSGDTVESTGNINDDDFDKQSSVTHVTSGGPDNDPCYTFAGGDDYLFAE